MKKLILFLTTLIIAGGLMAQCSDLFISGYVEGYGNNRALEIYNPTNVAKDLSGYSVGRYSNGDAAPNQFEGIQLPAEMLDPYDVFVVVVDKRDSLGTGLEVPVWNGYQLWDVILDEVTGDTIIDENGDPVYGVQYDTDNNNIPFYGDEYHEWLDLQGKADVFLCPVYDINNAMYFNGNDAVALISGTQVENDGNNIIDVIGVIGDNPGNTSSWETWEGQWIMRDASLTRNADIAGGSGIVAFAQGDTIEYSNWDISFKNDFSGIGEHDCVCAISGTNDINQVSFKMSPNPNTTRSLTIDAAEQIEKVEVYNLLGQLTQSEQFDFASDKVDINLNRLHPGIYLVNVYFSDNQISIQKLVVE